MTKVIAVYQIRNLLNEKIYVGSTNNVTRRFTEHKSLLRRNKHENQYLQNAWNKYGEEAFAFEMIEELNDLSVLKQREQFYLDSKKCYIDTYGYNICEEASLPPRRVVSDELKKKYSLLFSGAGNPMYNKKHTEETKQKISVINTGKIRSKSFREKCADNMRGNRYLLGYKFSEESKEKMSLKRKGIPKSEETKKKMKEASKNRVLSEQAKKNILMARRTFSDEQELEIFNRYQPRIVTQYMLAQEYQVSEETIRNILKRVKKND